MTQTSLPSKFQATDTVAIAVEKNLRRLETDGYGVLKVDETANEICLRFDKVKVRGENYDIALVRLAGALLEHSHFGSILMARLRDPDFLSHG